MKGKITQVYAGLFAVFVFIFLGVKYNYLGTLPLWAVVLEILFMAVVLAVLMLPSYILHKSTGCDVFNVFLNKSSLTKITFSSFYCILFVFASVRFLSLYVDILITALNSNANRFVLAVGILFVCAYSAYKGVFTASRCALISSVVTAIFIIIFLLGNISDIELSNLYRSNSTDDFFAALFSLLPVCVLPVIFSVISGSFRQSKSAFVWFLVIAQNASFGQMTSFDFLYMICISFCSFIIVSLLLCCINESTGVKKRGKNTFIFTLLIFVMYICTEVFPKAKELVQNDIIFAVMCAIYAVVLPIYALFRLKGGKQGD